MKFKVPESVLKETTKCSHDFACLTTGQCCYSDECKVHTANGKNVLFLEPNEFVNCPYWTRYGSETLCTCPTHNALYRQRN